MSGKELGNFNDKTRDKSNDGSSSSDFTRTQVNRQTFLTPEMKRLFNVYEDQKSSKVQKMVADANLYRLIGKNIDEQNDSSEQNKQEYGNEIFDNFTLSMLDEMLKKVLKDFPQRQWLKDRVESYLDQCAKQQHGVKDINPQKLQVFVDEANTDIDKRWVAHAAYRQFLRECKQGGEAESSQRN